MHALQALLLRLIASLSADTACRLGGTLGVLAFHLGVRRRIAAHNLTACLGITGTRRARLLRRSYATMGATFVQVFTIGGPDGPEQQVRILNPRWTTQVFRRHPSAVFLSGHLGDWEMGAHILTRHLAEVLVYAKAQHNPSLDVQLNAARARGGVRVVLVRPGDRTGAVQALKALRRGAALAMMADQKPSGGTPAWFLGQPAWCHDGPAFFARKAGVPIVSGLAVRVRAGRTVVLVGRPWLATGDHAADVQRCADQVSALIATVPGQYFWQHRRFAAVPPQLPPRQVVARDLRLIAAV